MNWAAVGRFIKRWVVDTGIAEKLGERAIEAIQKKQAKRDGQETGAGS